jgi:hypothetical protein
MKSKKLNSRKTPQGDILYFHFAKVAILLHYSFYNKKINKLHKRAVAKEYFWVVLQKIR